MARGPHGPGAAAVDEDVGVGPRGGGDIGKHKGSGKFGPPPPPPVPWVSAIMATSLPSLVAPSLTWPRRWGGCRPPGAPGPGPGTS